MIPLMLKWNPVLDQESMKMYISHLIHCGYLMVNVKLEKTHRNFGCQKILINHFQLNQYKTHARHRFGKIPSTSNWINWKDNYFSLVSQELEPHATEYSIYLSDYLLFNISSYRKFVVVLHVIENCL